MAEQVRITLTCDWHSKRGQHNISADAQRTTDEGKVLDLCDHCAILWDFAYPRRAWIEALPELLGSARTPVEKRTPRTKVLTTPAAVEEAPARGTQETLPLPEQRDGDTPTTALMVDCILCGDPVRYSHRGEHAKRKHDSTLEHVPYRPVGFTFEALCNGACGVDGCLAGYTTKKGLDGHINKLSQRGTASQAAKSQPTPAVQKKRAGPNNGHRNPALRQVTCPLDHRAGAPTPYWVNLKNRAGHADHHGLHITEIQWGNDAGLTWGARCTKHERCATYDNGAGFPFPSEESIRIHCIKEEQKAKKLADKQEQAEHTEPPERTLSAVAA
jgi:hypothetical protein